MSEVANRKTAYFRADNADLNILQVGDGAEVVFRRLDAPVASWTEPGIRWVAEYWREPMAYPVGQSWVVVTLYGPIIDWLHVMDDHRRVGIGTTLLTAIRTRWPDVVYAPATELGDRFLARKMGDGGVPA
jgi:GNAT superfamily N-acetyltransferase